MLRLPLVLTVNSSFQELEHLAAALAEAGLLSRYICSYANKERPWERALTRLPQIEKVYGRTLGRRVLVSGLQRSKVQECACIVDFVMALMIRNPFKNQYVRALNSTLVHARTRAIARAGAKALDEEGAVVASWGVAELAFRKMKNRYGMCVLNYPLAHHAFTKRYLLEEAEREPAFADTLNSHDMPEWLVKRMNHEIALSDKVLVGSSFVRDSFVSEGVSADKLMVIPYGADTSLFAPRKDKGVGSDRFRVLFVGQIGQRKGISYLLRAFRRFRGPGTSLTLVGRIQGDGRAFIPWKDLFQHVDHIPRVELADIYRQASVFLFPTLVEGMGIVVLEAMASGLPVITTPNGPGDIVRDGIDGFIIPPRDVEAIVNRLERLRADPVLRFEMSLNARKRAQEFTWTAYRNMAVGQLQEWLSLAETAKSIA